MIVPTNAGPNRSDGTEDGGGGLAKQIAAIVAVLSTSVAGISFMENPVGFVAAAALQYVANGLTSLAGHLGHILYVDVWGGLLGALGSAGGAVWDAGAAGADALEGVGGTVGGLIVDVAGSAGPFAPIAAIVIWAVVFVSLAYLVRGLWEGYKLIRTAIV